MPKSFIASKFRLFHYWRSSASWRVRMALSYKGIPFESRFVNLLDDSTDTPEHRARNPMGYIPVLEVLTELSDGTQPGELLIESLPIIEWVDELFPDPPLLPKKPIERAKVRALAEMINAGTQPLQNMPVLDFYSSEVPEQDKWARHWISNGLEAYEKQVAMTAGKFSFGDSFSLADICELPQIYNARRRKVDLSTMPNLQRIEKNSSELPCYQASHPDRFEPKN